MSKKLSRVMIAGMKSGSGKTTFTCALLNILKKRGYNIRAYKSGPDYIDPMFHRTVLGIPSGNLDTCFCDGETIRSIIYNTPCEYAVMEGVMGIYDGIGGISAEGSSYDIAKVTQTPVVLIVDAYGMGSTVCSVIKGILADDEAGLIKGIILNRISERFYLRLAPVLSEVVGRSNSNARLIGYIPKISDAELKSRHLGLVMPEEIKDINEKIDCVSGVIEKTCDVDAIVSIMEEANVIEESDNRTVKSEETVDADAKVTIAVARDEAFSFYYEENIELLKQCGARVVEFSPINDRHLPQNVDGILLGGGYPELHLEELSKNVSLKEELKTFVTSGRPVLAECGGFMYLHDTITDADGKAYPMVGAISGSCVNTGHLSRFGYVCAERINGGFDSDEAAGGLIHAFIGTKGHEYHYYDSTACGKSVIIKKIGEDKEWEGIHVNAGQVMGFMHLYYPSNPEFITKFVECMKSGRN